MSDQRKDLRITVVFNQDRDLHEKLSTWAHEGKLSVSWALRFLCRAGLVSHPHPPHLPKLSQAKEPTRRRLKRET